MAALANPRLPRLVKLSVIPLPLDASQKATQGGAACGDKSTGGVKPAQASTTLISLGSFEESIDNSSGTTTVTVLVNLQKEVTASWQDNATGANKVLASDLFNDVYWQDDHTVTKATSGNSVAGRVLGVDTLKGVLVEFYSL